MGSNPSRAIVLLLALASVGWLCGCSLLGITHSDEAILKALNSNETARRRAGLERLRSRRPGPGVARRVEELLSTDVDPINRTLAAEVLGRADGESATEELRFRARSDISWIVRRQALRSLVSILGAGAAGDLQYSVTRDAEPAVGVEAVDLAATVLPDDLAIPILLSALESPEKAVRLEAHAHLVGLTGLTIPPGDHEAWKARLAPE